MIETLPPSLHYQGQLTPDDWMDGYKVHQRLTGRSVIDTVISYFWWVALILLLVLSDGLMRILPAVLVVLTMVAQSRNRTRALGLLSQHYLESAAATVGFQSTIDATGFETTSEYYHDRRPWGVLKGWRETEKAFLLYEAPTAFRIIPKHIFPNAEDAATLRRWFELKLGSPGTLRHAPP